MVPSKLLNSRKVLADLLKTPKADGRKKADPIRETALGGAGQFSLRGCLEGVRPPGPSREWQ